MVESFSLNPNFTTLSKYSLVEMLLGASNTGS